LAARVVYKCSECPRTFPCAPAVASHEKQAHSTASSPWQWLPKVCVRTAIQPSGEVHVCLAIGGKTPEEKRTLQQEAEAAIAERTAMLEQERKKRGEMQNGLGRRGAAKWGSYTPVFQVNMIELLDRIFEDPKIENKQVAFEGDKRSKGTPYTTATKWLGLRGFGGCAAFLVAQVLNLRQSNKPNSTPQPASKQQAKQHISTCVRATSQTAHLNLRQNNKPNSTPQPASEQQTEQHTSTCVRATSRTAHLNLRQSNKQNSTPQPASEQQPEQHTSTCVRATARTAHLNLRQSNKPNSTHSSPIHLVATVAAMACAMTKKPGFIFCLKMMFNVL
jgi:hypothetical protein